MTPVDTWRRMAPSWAEMCWHSTERPHRAPILRALESLAPFDSVLELGCNAGPNLRLIHERWPAARLGGIDVNTTALGYLSGIPAAGFIGDVRDLLPDFADGDYDVVLSCYCLAYIEPGQIADVLANMRRIARVGLVIAEPMVWHPAHPSEAVPDVGIPEWMHNYLALLPVAIPDRTYDVTPSIAVEPPIDRLDTILTVRL